MPGAGFFSEWVAAALREGDLSQGVAIFQENMWKTWKQLYQSPGFRYFDEDEKANGIFSVSSRTKYEVDTESGTIATYSAGLEKEDKYSRDILNRKRIRLNKAEESNKNRELVFFGYEAPLLRVTTEKGGRFRISADLVALENNGEIVIVETKLPGGDPLDKALLQVYGYAFFLACHLATPSQPEILEHARQSFAKVQGGVDKNKTDQPQVTPYVKYMIVAPSQYFYENLAVNEKFGTLLETLDSQNLKRLKKAPIGCTLPRNPVFYGFVIVENNHLYFDNFGSVMEYQSDVCRWHNFEQLLDYAEAERLAQIKCKQSSLFSEAARDRGEYVFRKKPYKVPYCLPSGHERENLFEEIRDEAYQFFDELGVSWHHKGENHLLSSQAYCVNFLFPFADKPEALKALLQPLFPHIKKMLPIEKGRYVTFEWDGRDISEKGEEKNYLNEHGFSKPRGTYSTYADAAVKFKTTNNKTQVVLIEWKYTEKYNGASLAEGSEGYNRLNTYLSVCQESGCPVNINNLSTGTDVDAAMKVLFYEPFYQLFREQLLAHVIEKKNPDITAAFLLHICPERNTAFHNTVTSPKIREMFPGESVLDIWKELLIKKNRFASTTPEKLFQAFPHSEYPELQKWSAYMASRYRLKFKKLNRVS